MVGTVLMVLEAAGELVIPELVADVPPEPPPRHPAATTPPRRIRRSTKPILLDTCITGGE